METLRIPPLSAKDRKRFQKKIQSGRSKSCWEWQAAKSRGYGKFGLKGHLFSAHRIAWFLSYGPIPTGLCVLHSCDNHSCCNEDHLFLGTNADNTHDAVRKNRMARGIRNGTQTHPEKIARGEQNGNSKFTTKQVLKIRARYKTRKMTHWALAQEYGATERCIQQIVNRKTWTHV